MVEFCKCGSIIVNEHCSNKNCSFSNQNKEGSGKPASGKKTGSRTKTINKSTAKSAVKSTNPRKSSKCITYNLYEMDNEEKNNAQ